MAEYSKVIQVPKPEPGSFNKNRPAGSFCSLKRCICARL